MKEQNKFKKGMVDVSAKKITSRTARALATVELGQKAYKALVNHESPKGDVLETAKVAGIMAVKSTAQIIPMCHPLNISKVHVEFVCRKDKHAVDILTEVKFKGQTGVEMEALLGASAAALTIYDMLKWADKGIVISQVKLLSKTGGKSGRFKSA